MMRRPPRRAGYFIRNRWYIGRYNVMGQEGELEPLPRAGELVELTRAELREIEQTHGPVLPTYRRVPASYAHRWVRAGNIHHTGLYTDHDGRIRYAEGEVCD
jgi:hypothetical protein